MKQQVNKRDFQTILRSCCFYFSIFTVAFATACDQIKSPKTETFIGENVPPLRQEFRWSNGKMPKSFDPALASASPETDIVRALYEGLTDLDSKTLEPVPAIAEKWTASEDHKVWTFKLREDAKWSNGRPIVAQDFVRSWKRLTELGSKVSQRNLFKNIVGMDSEDVLPVFADEPDEQTEEQEDVNFSVLQKPAQNSNSKLADPSETSQSSDTAPTPQTKIETVGAPKTKNSPRFGVEAIGDLTLKVTLIHADKEFPLLVAHPIFHPIFGDGSDFEVNPLNLEIVTNGAFRLISVGDDGISLEKSSIYWNKDQIKLEKVKFVPAEDAESALAAYRNGEVDAVTNANFQPLALKLLEPFKNEYHETIHGALNFYQFNLMVKPFDDLRVREALSISIERERITEDEMDGSTKPALNFLPFDENKKKLIEDVEKAKNLLTEAGYSNGENFPTIKLVINRNNVQQRIANSVAKMWQKHLNLKTDVVVRDQTDFQNSIQTGDYSLARRGIVLPTNNETSNMLAMFDDVKFPEEDRVQDDRSSKEDPETRGPTGQNSESETVHPDSEESASGAEEQRVFETENKSSLNYQAILTEDQALVQLPAIPLYFPNSYSLVKPYIQGVEFNPFDSFSLKNIQINVNWHPDDPRAKVTATE